MSTFVPTGTTSELESSVEDRALANTIRYWQGGTALSVLVSWLRAHRLLGQDQGMLEANLEFAKHPSPELESFRKYHENVVCGLTDEISSLTLEHSTKMIENSHQVQALEKIIKAQDANLENVHAGYKTQIHLLETYAELRNTPAVEVRPVYLLPAPVFLLPPPVFLFQGPIFRL